MHLWASKLPRKSKILSITPDKKNTYKITTSLGIDFKVPKEILLKMSLIEGGELSASDINILKSSKDYYKVRKILYYYMRL